MQRILLYTPRYIRHLPMALCIVLPRKPESLVYCNYTTLDTIARLGKPYPSIMHTKLVPHRTSTENKRLCCNIGTYSYSVEQLEM